MVKSFDLANLSQNGLETSWQQGMSRGVGNLNLADISGYTEYSGGVNGLFTLNGGDSFKLKMDSQNLPFKTLLPNGAGGVIDGAHTFSVGIQFDFITRDNTGNFSLYRCFDKLTGRYLVPVLISNSKFDMFSIILL